MASNDLTSFLFVLQSLACKLALALRAASFAFNQGVSKAGGRGVIVGSTGIFIAGSCNLPQFNY